MDKTRQWGPIERIRKDHIRRYEFAANRLRGRKVLDLACGCGYGSWILHGAGNNVWGIDISREAIDYAEKHYQGPAYYCQEAKDVSGSWDALVTFETLEHLESPEDLLGKIDAPLVFASVPNEERYPFKEEKFAEDEYPHKRHYTPSQFEKLLNDAGFKVRERFCQHRKDGELLEGTDGEFLLYIANR